MPSEEPRGVRCRRKPGAIGRALESHNPRGLFFDLVLALDDVVASRFVLLFGRFRTGLLAWSGTAGLSLALSSPSIQYGDLDGHLDLVGDPTVQAFRLEDGWLVATDSPGLGCTVDL